MGMHIVLVFNGADGWDAYGPFKTYDDAYAFVTDDMEDWQILPLNAPSEYEA